MNLFRLFIPKIVTVLFLSSNVNAQLNLSPSEKLWIKNNPTIRTAASMDWPPFDFTIIDKNRKIHQGISQDILDIISSKTGLTFQNHINNWHINLDKIQKNKLDLLPILNRSDDRTNYLDFSDTYIQSMEFFFVREDLQVSSINDLNGYTVAIPISFSYISLFKEHFPQIEIIQTQNNIEAIIAVLEGRADILYDSFTALSFSLKQLGITSIVPFKASNISPVTQLYMAVNKDNKILLKIINKALASISQNQRNLIFEKWHRYGSKIEFIKQSDRRLLYWTSFILLLAISIIFIWAKNLSKEVKKTKQIQNELLQEKENFQTLFEDTSDGHIIYQNNTFVDCNQTVVDMLEYKDKKTFLELSISLVIFSKQPDGTDSLAFIQKMIGMCFKNGSTRFEYLATRKKGSKFWIDIIFTLIKYDGKNAIHATWRDISQQKQLTKDLLIAQQKASEANNAKSIFLANMSHEIRTPMNAIVGFTDLLYEQIENPKHKSFISTVKQATNHLLELINNILDLSKIESGKIKLKLTPINPFDLFNDICLLFSLDIKKKDLNFEVFIDSNYPDCILIDPRYIRQTLLNLLSNALKFTDKGHIYFRAKVGSFEDHLSKISMIFEIEDTGIGIEKSQQQRIFNSFEQHKGQDIFKYQGTGLGLSICKQLVKEMGGTIKVSSELNKGTIFTVKIPNIDIAAITLNDQHENKFSNPNINTIMFNKSNILVVDDIDYNRELVKQVFAKRNIDIFEAKNGQEAVDIVNSHVIDLVLMDIRMPIMDGYEASRIIRNTHPDIIIVALTASTFESNENYDENLFNAFIKKPVGISVLLNTIADFITSTNIQPNNIEQPFLQHPLNNTQLKKLIHSLSTQTINLWQTAITSKKINDIKLLATALQEIQNRYPTEILQIYTSLLNKNLDTFNISGLQELLDKYQQLIIDIQSLDIQKN